MNRFASVMLLTALCAVARDSGSVVAAEAAKAAPAVKPAPAPAAAVLPGAVDFIDTSFENASPLWYEFAEDGTVMVNLNYDHQRSSLNRAAGHFHFRLQAPKGRRITLEFVNLKNVWNNTPGSVGKEIKQVVVSQDGRNWTPVPTEAPEDGRVRVTLEMPGDSLFVARAEPYRLSDLNRLIEEIKSNPLVKVTSIGKTVQGRELEIIRVGRESAPRHIFLRARAHPWEPAGNWVVEGLVRRLLKGDAVAQKCLAQYSVCILPMANKDGVERGGTRFNLGGKDLNREWDKPADPQLAPENAALERWLDAEIQAGRRPTLALDLHNDGNGLLHLSRPEGPEGEKHLARMLAFEKSLRAHTWFTEGSSKPSFRNPGSMGEGWFTRFGIDAAILEFHCNYIAGLKEPAMGKGWLAFGAGLAEAFDQYVSVNQ
ncbi:M14-type cytosolic carboxypeptidase [Verrucomicrobium sp. BvORR034]|uniref:M14-type cytosolic carboxypeptidase n=1 Tax=Verrucomicrobium sp. BvORR034 TaxID=1396418 RepID=UPI0006784D22|nr:M14-type cytosolic carboxypeptidase [Verrucomicrobium sp. BvORR034]